MPRGRSYQQESWLDHAKGEHIFVHQDFAHEKTLVFKAKLQNLSDGISVKQAVTERPQGVDSQGQLKYWFTLKPETSLYGRLGTDSQLQLQYDHGIRKAKGIHNNFYFGSIFNRTFTEKKAFVGLQLFQEGLWSVNGRLSYDYSNKGLKFDQKIRYRKNELLLSQFSSIDTVSKTFDRCGLLVGWIPRESRLFTWNSYLRLQKNVKGSISMLHDLTSNVTLNFFKQVNENQKLGIQTRLSLYGFSSSMISSFWVGSQWKFGDSIFKAKVSNALSHAFCVKNKLGSNGTYSLGMEGSDVLNKCKFKFGVKVDLNL